MEHLNATMVGFSKERDVIQTANLLRQCGDESVQNPEQQRASSKVQGDQPTRDEVYTFWRLLFPLRTIFRLKYPSDLSCCSVFCLGEVMLTRNLYSDPIRLHFQPISLILSRCVTKYLAIMISQEIDSPTFPGAPQDTEVKQLQSHPALQTSLLYHSPRMEVLPCGISGVLSHSDLRLMIMIWDGATPPSSVL